MKVNELMVSDLVYNHRNWICSIVEIHKDSAVIIAKHYGEEEFKLDDLRPIPLTPEILEKNGFIIKKKWAQIGNFGDNPLIMWHFEDDAFLHDFKHELEIHQNDTGKVHIRIPCEYLHELQHALRLCGIDKTITL